MPALSLSVIFRKVPSTYATAFEHYTLSISRSRLRYLLWASIVIFLQIVLLDIIKYRSKILFSDPIHLYMLYFQGVMIISIGLAVYTLKKWPRGAHHLSRHVRISYYACLTMGSLYLIGRSVFVYLERGSLNFYMTALITLQLLLLTNWKARICISVVGLLSMSTLIYLFPPISGSSIKISYIYECIGITFMTFLGSTYFYNLEIQKFLNLHTIQIQKEKLETYTCLLEQEKQQQDHKLEQRSRELTSYTLQEMKNSRFLEEIRKSIQQEEPAEIKKIPNLISIHLQGESKWTYFKDVFENVHPDFFSRVHAQFPALNSNDIRLIALLKMKLSTKEIADILGISPQSANTARYRLRKRLQLNPDDDLEKLIYQL